MDATEPTPTDRALVADRTTIPKPADRGAWLAARRPWFNASAAAVLFDRHKYQTAGDYAAEKLTGEETDENRAMIRGTRLEDAIARWWADENHVEVSEPDTLYTAGRVMATVDRLVVASGTPVEIKTTKIPTARPADYWIDQCQAIMACVDSPTLELVWFDASMDLQTATLTADVDHQQTLLARAERFMAAIDLGFAPDWVMLSAKNIAAIYDKPKERVDLTADEFDLVRAYDMVRSVRLEAEKDEAAIKDRLARVLMDKEKAAYNGLDVLSWTAVAAAPTFNRAQFRKDHPELHDEYLEPGKPSRRFNLMTGF
jgi:hypothetical protein